MPSSATPEVPEDLPGGSTSSSPKVKWYRSLSQELVEQGHLPMALLESISLECLEKDQSFPLVLASRRLLPEATAYKAWAKVLGVAYFDLDADALEQETLELLPADLCERLRVVPVRNTNGEITVAMVDPNDVAAVDEIRRHLNSPMLVVMATPSRVQETLSLRSASEVSQHRQLDLANLDLDRLSNPEDVEQIAGDNAIIEIVNQIFTKAVLAGASDIHIEPREEKLRIRFRVDGVLEEFHVLPQALHAPLTSRIKIMANLDIAEKRKPQDGGIVWSLSSAKNVEFRVSSLPTVYGEKVVLRILDRSQIRHGLDDLSLFPEQLDIINDITQMSHGIFFSTGPTGSGKTTTLYAILQALNAAQLNVTTIEDPVEYRLPLINQIAVDVPAGRTFANVLRSILRQDPDVILVGEIRDQETATIAVQAALTGHLVLSTLHSNSSVEAIPRLLNIGVERHLLAPSLAGVHAQRLVRKICPHCEFEVEADLRILSLVLGHPVEESVPLRAGRGCGQCRGSGYLGRLPLHEILVMTDELRRLIYEEGSTRQILTAACRSGLRTLRQDGLRKCLAGLTSLEEVARVTSGSA